MTSSKADTIGPERASLEGKPERLTRKETLFVEGRLHERRVEAEYTAALLKYPWEMFITVTFRTPKKDWMKVLAAGRDIHYRFRAKGSFIAAEPFRHTPYLHLHMISNFGNGAVVKPTTDEVKFFCNKEFGKSDAELIYSGGAAGYVSKCAPALGWTDAVGEVGFWEMGGCDSFSTMM